MNRKQYLQFYPTYRIKQEQIEINYFNFINRMNVLPVNFICSTKKRIISPNKTLKDKIVFLKTFNIIENHQKTFVNQIKHFFFGKSLISGCIAR